MRNGRILGLAFLYWGPLACSSAPGGGADAGVCPMAAQALETATSHSGWLHVAVRTCPNQPPLRGLDTVEYTITDDAGAPQDGLAVSALPFMTQMGHGTSAQDSVEPEGSGRYLINDVYFFMAGQWELQTTFGPGDGGDSVDPTFQID